MYFRTHCVDPYAEGPEDIKNNDHSVMKMISSEFQ